MRQPKSQGGVRGVGRLPRPRVGLALVGLGAVGLLAGAPMQAAILEGLPLELPVSVTTAVAAQLAQTFLLVVLAVWCGLTLGRRVGLGAPVVESLVERRPFGHIVRTALPAIGAVGIGGALLLLALDAWLFAGQVEAGLVPELSVWEALGGVLYAGLVEELLVRFGFLSLVAWVAARTLRDRGVPSGAAVRWISILVAAVLFGVLHLPATAALVDPTGMVVVRALLLNGLIGAGFGWLFWRYGLFAAVTAHLLADLLLVPVAYVT